MTNAFLSILWRMHDGKLKHLLAAMCVTTVCNLVFMPHGNINLVRPKVRPAHYN